MMSFRNFAMILLIISPALSGCMDLEKAEKADQDSDEIFTVETEQTQLLLNAQSNGSCTGDENETSNIDGQAHVCRDGELVPLYSNEEAPEEHGPEFVPSCNITASQGTEITPNHQEWPEVTSGAWLEVPGLSTVYYENSTSPSVGWDAVNVNGSPDAEDGEGGTEKVVSPGLDWACGYNYEVKVPVGYDPDVNYPLMMFLHGGVTSAGLEFYFRFLTGNFYMPADDKYIIVQPAKLEVDWDPKKALDVLEDVKSHMSVNDSRVYLTGLSMGGRGTFIVAAALPDYFAALMPLSPHHDPFPYTELAGDVAHLPIWMSHGDSDNTSSYEMAAEMAGILEVLGAEVQFRTIVGGEHEGWFGIYIDPEAMGWVLSKSRDVI